MVESISALPFINSAYPALQSPFFARVVYSALLRVGRRASDSSCSLRGIGVRADDFLKVRIPTDSGIILPQSYSHQIHSL